MIQNKEMFYNSLYLAIEKAFKILSYLITGVVIAREAGSAIFGYYSTILSIVVIFNSLAATGLNSLLTREFIRKSHIVCFMFASAFHLRVIASIILSLVCSIAVSITSDLSSGENVVAGILIFFSVNQLADLYLESKLLNKIISIYKIIGYGVGSAIKIVVVIQCPSVINLLLAHLIELAITLTLSFFSIKRVKPDIFKKIGKVKKHSFLLLSNGAPLAFSSIACLLYMKLDQMFILKMLGATSSGEYAAAVRLCEGLFLFSTIVLPSVFPKLISYYKYKDSKFDNLIGKIFLLFLAFGSFVALFLTIFSNEIIFTLFGDNYAESVDVLIIYSLIIPIVYIGDLFSRWLVITNNLNLSVYRHSLGLVLNIIFNLLLIPEYGIKGAAIATFISYLAAVFLFSLFSRKAIKFYNFAR